MKLKEFKVQIHWKDNQKHPRTTCYYDTGINAHCVLDQFIEKLKNSSTNFIKLYDCCDTRDFILINKQTITHINAVEKKE